MKIADLKQIMKAHAEAERNPPRDAWKDQTGFNIVSLGAWLLLAQQCRIPYVGAHRVTELRIDDIMALDSPEPPPPITGLDKVIKAAPPIDYRDNLRRATQGVNIARRLTNITATRMTSGELLK